MDTISTVRLDALSALDPSVLPSEFRLFTFGDNATSKGTFKLDADGATALMAAYKKQGIELHVDYEHDRRNAAAWFNPEVRPDGVWASNVRWTPRAAEMLKGREYRYFSPTFGIDDAKRITRLVNVALTNLPATENQQALIAASERDSGVQLKPSIETNDQLTRRIASSFRSVMGMANRRNQCL